MAAGIINLQKASGGITKISSVDGTGVTELVVPESGNLVSINTAVTDNAIARYDGTTGKLQNSAVIINDNGNLDLGSSGTITNSKLKIGGDIEIGVGGINGTQKHCRIRSFGESVYAGGIAFDYYYYNGSSYVFKEGSKIDSAGNFLLTSGTGALGYGAGAGGSVTQLTSKSTAVTLNKPSGQINMNNASLAAGATTAFQLFNNLIKQGDLILVNYSSVPAVSNYSIRVYTPNNADGYCYIVLKNESGSSLSDVVGLTFSLIKGANA